MDGRGTPATMPPVRLNALGSLNDSLSLTEKKKPTRRGADPANQKRRCVSTACIACRKRKSKCDGVLPSCAACSSVYGTECIYDPNSDHRRKGVYREKIDSMKAQSSTLQILIEAILNAAEEDVPAIVKRIRTCDSLDTVAESILKQDFTNDEEEEDTVDDDEYTANQAVEGERELARKMGELRLENGSVRFIGGTSHLIYLGDPADTSNEPESDDLLSHENPITSWSEVIKDRQVIVHLINLYFDWHYPYFTTLSKSLFFRDFVKGKPATQPRSTSYCSSLLVNAMLALGCHFTSVPAAYSVPGDNRTKGDHFFAEAKRLILENDEYEKPRLTTVQALALMSVREAGCGREAKGWVYSGMSFRMAQDIGLNLDIGGISTDKDSLNDQEIDARRITFWGCFLFDKCWSNYLGRLPQLPKNSYSVPKFDVFPDEDAEAWAPYSDTGFDESLKQPSRTRAVALQLSTLCEISSDLLLFFYHPNHIGRSSGKSVELKKLSELHRRLEEWRKEVPREFEPKEGQLPHVILVQYVSLLRPDSPDSGTDRCVACSSTCNTYTSSARSSNTTQRHLRCRRTCPRGGYARPTQGQSPSSCVSTRRRTISDRSATSQSTWSTQPAPSTCSTFRRRRQSGTSSTASGNSKRSPKTGRAPGGPSASSACSRGSGTSRCPRRRRRCSRGPTRTTAPLARRTCRLRTGCRRPPRRRPRPSRSSTVP